MIHAQNLTRRFGRVLAVDDLTFRIDTGSVVGLLGPNGAGKTTTLRMLTGVLHPTRGQVHVDGIDAMADPCRARSRIGYLPESVPLYEDLLVREYLAFRGRIAGLCRADRRSGVSRVLAACNLQEVSSRVIGHLSKGYRQRIGLAAAMLHDPPILVLDEPTAGMDPAQVHGFRDLIEELSHRHTILVSSHILTEIEKICDSVLLIGHGRLRLEGPMEDVGRAARSGRRYWIETDALDPVAILHAVPGVAGVEVEAIEGKWRRVEVIPETGSPDLREALARALRSRRAVVRELGASEPSLEQIFLQLMESVQEVAP